MIRPYRTVGLSQTSNRFLQPRDAGPLGGSQARGAAGWPAPPALPAAVLAEMGCASAPGPRQGASPDLLTSALAPAVAL